MKSYESCNCADLGGNSKELRYCGDCVEPFCGGICRNSDGTAPALFPCKLIVLQKVAENNASEEFLVLDEIPSAAVEGGILCSLFFWPGWKNWWRFWCQDQGKHGLAQAHNLTVGEKDCQQH